MSSPSIRRVIVFSAFALSLASCSLFEGRETGGQYVDDATITSKVKAAFVGDPQIKSMQINVETMKGVVQLSGFVSSKTAEDRAVELANNVSGVKQVKDTMILKK